MLSRQEMIALPPETMVFEREMAAVFGERFLQQEPLARHTTFRLGGPADYFVTARSCDELSRAMELAGSFGIQARVIGSGANLLVSDRGIRGLVIANRAEAMHFAGTHVVVESGALLAGLVNACIQRGLANLEWAISIPGTVGGAVVNNAGAYGACIADCLVRAELLFANDSRLWQDCSWFDYSYRYSRLKGSMEAVVLQAEFALIPGEREELKKKAAANSRQRRESQPAGATIGSMFKNPPGDYAGRLIEAAGLKGRQIGQALISPKHGNFFVNLGQATALEMKQLIELTQQEVWEKFQVRLELEIELAGEWS